LKVSKKKSERETCDRLGNDRYFT